MKDVVSDYLEAEVTKAEAMLEEVRKSSSTDHGGVFASSVKMRINVLKNMLENRKTDLKGKAGELDTDRRYRIKDNLNGTFGRPTSSIRGRPPRRTATRPIERHVPEPRRLAPTRFSGSRSLFKPKRGSHAPSNI